MVSLIESILAMEERTIPGQYRYRSAPEQFEMDSTKLEISSEARPWEPQVGGRRTAAISGFGFGGTNAHLIVSEQDTPEAPAARRTAGSRAESGTGTRVKAVPQERIAVVGWSARLPGTAGRQDVTQWLDGTREIDAGFGDSYPAPSFQEVRMPPATVRTIDRCQLMILSCAHELRGQLSEFWDEKAERTGVVVGHMGPTRAAMLYANRCYLDDIERGLRADPALAAEPRLAALVARLRERVRSMTPPSNEDSFPGMMPNVISARVANYFDLHGPNITVDAGLGSALSAFSTAARYLHSGELDFVLAGGINGNSLPEYGPLLREVFGEQRVEPAEGAFLFGLTTESTAREAGLEVLAFVDELTPGSRPADGAAELDCGAEGEYSRYLGAAGGLALLRALRRPSGTTVIRCRENSGDVATALVVTSPEQPAGSAGPAGAPAEADRPLLLVRRYATTLRPEPALTASGPAGHPLPAGAVVLTDNPELVARLAAPAAAITVLSTVAPAGPRPGWHHLPEVTPEAVRAALAALPGPVQALRVVADLTASVPAEEAFSGAIDGVQALHDLVFLTVQQRYEELGGASSSVVFLLLGAMLEGVPHPLAGLFTGLAKCVHLELAEATCYAFLAATSDPALAARLLAPEAAAVRTFPIVYHDGERRLVPALQDAPAPQPAEVPGPGPLDRDSVVLALGGARGITAELLTALAERYGSRIFALGSNALDGYPSETFEGTDEEFAATRSAFISARMRAGGSTVAESSRRFDRMTDARTARRNLDRMARHSGAGRVSYLTCDARDEGSVRAAVDAVLAEHGRIDLVINAPGLNRSAMIRDKDFGEFRRIRDLKLAAHRNLHRALAGRAPRMWCDFGSLLGFFGQRGEADYASGNDYLATAAGYTAATTGIDEFVIGWTLWDEVGMGANELTRAYFKRAGSYSHMPVQEGIRHFLAELAGPRDCAGLVHLGEAERVTVEQFYPGYLDGRAAAGPRRGRFYLRRELPAPDGQEGTAVSFECSFDLDTDGYLEHHLVRGIPTLPGTFVTELAAEAALHLVPGGDVVALEDVRFEHFLQVHREIPQGPKRITARIADRIGDLTTVEVTVSYDVVSPSGVQLVSGRPHFRARVLVNKGFSAAPVWQPWDDREEYPVPDPYHAEGAPVRLTGPFVATTATRSGPRGARALYRAGLDPAQAPWSSFLVPAVLLDAMARTGVLAPVDGLIPVAAPLSIRRVDLYQQANDLELMAEHGQLDLYVVNPGFGGPRSDGNRFVAVAPGGRVVAQMKDLTATVIGHLDPATGVVHAPGEVSA